MKIMYLLFSFTVGGTECLVANICNQMADRGEEVHLYVINDLVDDNLLNTIDSRVRIQLLRRKVGSKDKISPLFDVAKYIKSQRIDVVHCNSFDAPKLLVISKFINPSCKIISTIHGNGQFKDSRKIDIALKNWVCDRFIGISTAVEEDIINTGIDREKVERVYNGIDVSKFDCQESKIFDDKNIVLGCIARIMPDVKGQDILLRAIKGIKRSHPNVQVLFAGGVATDQQQAYEELIRYVKDHSLESNVRFLGNIDDVPGVLRMIDICIIPSRTEGFGLSLVEALSMGVPCIASNTAGPKEIITNEGCGELFENGNSDSLCSKIEEVLSEYDKFKTSVWNHRMQVREKYSIEHMCDCLLNVYCQS